MANDIKSKKPSGQTQLGVYCSPCQMWNSPGTTECDWCKLRGKK